MEFSNFFDSVVLGHKKPHAVFLEPLSSIVSDFMVPFCIVPKNTISFSDGGTLNEEVARLPGIPSVQSDPCISLRQWGVYAPEWHTHVTYHGFMAQLLTGQ